MKPSWNEPTVGEIMTRNVMTLHVEQSLLDAMTFIHSERVRHLPVISNSKLVGIVTDRDIKRASPTALVPDQRAVWERVVRDTTLGKIMTRDPMTISPDAKLSEALKIFVDQRIGCLPVMQGEELVGIVTARDLFKAMLKVFESTS